MVWDTLYTYILYISPDNNYNSLQLQLTFVIIIGWKQGMPSRENANNKSDQTTIEIYIIVSRTTETSNSVKLKIQFILRMKCVQKIFTAALTVH